MKKLLAPLGIAAVLFAACNVSWSDLAMPEEVQVKTEPGLYLPLTSNLFAGEKRAKYSPEELINKHLDTEAIKEMIGGSSMPNITVATYADPANPNAPWTYLLRYPMADMPLDLGQYMGDLDVELPKISQNVGDVNKQLSDIQGYINNANTLAGQTNATLRTANQRVHDQNPTGAGVDISGIQNTLAAIEGAQGAINLVLGNDPETYPDVVSTIQTENTTIRTQNSAIKNVNANIMIQNSTAADDNSSHTSNVIRAANTAINAAKQPTSKFNQALTAVGTARTELDAAATTVKKNEAIVNLNEAIVSLNEEIGKLQAALIPAITIAKNTGLTQQYLAPYMLSGVYGLPITKDDLVTEYVSNNPPEPSSVSIRDMANLVESVTYTELGIRIAGDYKDVFKITVSDGNTSDGKLDFTSTGDYRNDGYTYFVDSPAALNATNTWKPPKNRSDLDITVELQKFPPLDSEGNINVQPEFVLEWTEASVNPGGNGELTDTLPLDLTALGKQLNGIQFGGPVEASLYVSGLLSTTATASFTIGPVTINHQTIPATSIGPLPLTPLPPDAMPKFSDDDIVTTWPTPSSLPMSLPLTDPLNISLVTEVPIVYTVNIGDTTITKEEVEAGSTISAIMLLKLPLSLQYTGAPFTDADAANYETIDGRDIPDLLIFKMKDENGVNELDFNDMLGDGDDDLLDPIKDGDVPFELTNISLFLTNCDTSLLQGMWLAIKPDKNNSTAKGKLIPLSGDTGRDILIADLGRNAKLTPAIEILVEKTGVRETDNKPYADLPLKKDGKFSFGLRVEVDSTINESFTL
ncbi:MAG: hypothetical protein LBP19_02585 [Treponema sp.]|nr:hypothetical protein [Treponema sp.]